MAAPSTTGGRRAFSLVEVLVALALLALSLITVTGLHLSHHRAQVRAGERMAAQAYLLNNMERLRAMAPLEAGRQVWDLQDEGSPKPRGIPAEGGRLVLETEPWEGARPHESVYHVRLTLHWVSAGERRSASLEVLMPGPVEDAP